MDKERSNGKPTSDPHGQGQDGDITALCGSGNWGRITKRQAILEIEAETHVYYVHEVEPPVRVQVVPGKDGEKYLRTVSDRTSRNNLDNLPNC